MVLQANILLFLRGSPLASISTQLSSVPRMQRDTKDGRNRERQQRAMRKKKTKQHTNKSVAYSKHEVLKDFRSLEFITLKFTDEHKCVGKDKLHQKIQLTDETIEGK